MGGPGVQSVSLRVGGELGERQDRRLDAGLPEPQPFLDERHAEPRRPRLQRREGYRDVAVTVAVGLDHGHHLGTFGPQRPNVVANRLEVDRRHRRPPVT